MKRSETNRVQLALIVKCAEFFSNMYSRIAEQCGVDRSYVSRVARGERHSATIERRLVADIAKFKEQLLRNRNNSEVMQDRSA